MEWSGVVLYGLLVTAVYLTRLSSHVEKYATGGTLNRPTLGPLLLPAAVCCGVLVFLLWQALRARRDRPAFSS